MKIAFILAGFFLLLLLLEALFPLRHRTWALVRRLLVNLCVSALAFAAAAWIVRPIGLSLAAWMSAKSFGLLHIVPLPAVVQFGLAFLLMDLTFYYWHLANHMLPVLWRFHNVHHIDPDLDVSTALRFHAGEVLFSAGFRALQVSLIGLPPLTYMIYEGVFQASPLFQHSNIRLPLQVERLLNTVLVTPACTVSIILSSQGRPTRTTRSFSPGGTGSTGACDSMFHNPPSSLASQPIRSQRTTHCGTSSSYPSAGNGITGVGPMATSQCATPPRPACRGPVCWSKMARILPLGTRSSKRCITKSSQD